MADTTLLGGHHSLQGSSSEPRYIFIPLQMFYNAEFQLSLINFSGSSDSLPNNSADPLHPLHCDEEGLCCRGDGHSQSQSKVL